MNKQMLIGLSLVFLALSGLMAQGGAQKGMGVIIYAEGDELSIYRAATLKTYAVSTGTVMGLLLENGDLVQTGPGTFIEIQLLPSQSVVKVAENTSFRMTGLNTAGGSTIDMIYGRIKAKVDPVLGQSGFAIRGKTSVAAVRGTEFGYDIVAVPGVGQEPSSQIYSFDGTVAVYPLQPEDSVGEAGNQVFDNDSFKGRKAWTVPAGKMIAVFDTPDDKSKAALGKSAGTDPVTLEGRRSVVASDGIKNSLKVYWKNHDDKGTPYSNEDLQSKFYGIKIAKSGEPETIAPSPSPVATPGPAKVPGIAAQTSLADSIAPMTTGKAIDTLSPNQYALVDDDLKLSGILLTSFGLAGNLLGSVFYNYGTDLGMTRPNSQTAGVVSYAVSGTMILSGLICYLIGLFE